MEEHTISYRFNKYEFESLLREPKIREVSEEEILSFLEKVPVAFGTIGIFDHYLKEFFETRDKSIFEGFKQYNSSTDPSNPLYDLSERVIDHVGVPVIYEDFDPDLYVAARRWVFNNEEWREMIYNYLNSNDDGWVLFGVRKDERGRRILRFGFTDDRFKPIQQIKEFPLEDSPNESITSLDKEENQDRLSLELLTQESLNYIFPLLNSVEDAELFGLAALPNVKVPKDTVRKFSYHGIRSNNKEKFDKSKYSASLLELVDNFAYQIYKEGVTTTLVRDSEGKHFLVEAYIDLETLANYVGVHFNVWMSSTTLAKRIKNYAERKGLTLPDRRKLYMDARANKTLTIKQLMDAGLELLYLFDPALDLTNIRTVKEALNAQAAHVVSNYGELINEGLSLIPRFYLSKYYEDAERKPSFEEVFGREFFEALVSDEQIALFKTVREVLANNNLGDDEKALYLSRTKAKYDVARALLGSYVNGKATSLFLEHYNREGKKIKPELIPVLPRLKVEGYLHPEIQQRLYESMTSLLKESVPKGYEFSFGSL